MDAVCVPTQCNGFHASRLGSKVVIYLSGTICNPRSVKPSTSFTVLSRNIELCENQGTILFYTFSPSLNFALEQQLKLRCSLQPIRCKRGNRNKDFLSKVNLSKPQHVNIINYKC